MAAQPPLFDPSRMAAPAAAPAPRVMTVTQLNLLIKRVIGDHLPGTIHVVGQISNCCRHTSGHLYLTLKDERSEIRAVMWKSTAASLKFRPEDGLEVVATGSIDVFENRGQYQFYIRSLEPRGTGALELAFRQLRDRLAKEGLFDPARKRKPPRYPRRIGLVTSPVGAAIRDVLRTLQRRFPCAGVLLCPVRVQGEGAAAEIAAAIERLNAHAEALGGIDVLIVARGGGSLEDLWAFNEESVARAIATSRIPVISGVGHEVDVTIADLVADVRAATPTAAAELAVPVRSEVLEDLSRREIRLWRAVQHRLDLARSKIDGLGRNELLREPSLFVLRRQQSLDEAAARLQMRLGRCLHEAHERLRRAERFLLAREPAAQLRSKHEQLERVAGRLQWAVLARERQEERRLDGLTHRLAAGIALPIAQSAGAQLAHLHHRLLRCVAHRFDVCGQLVEGAFARLQANDPRRLLERGFTITRTTRGRIITKTTDVKPGDKIVTQTAAGEIESRVLDAKQAELFD